VGHVLRERLGIVAALVAGLACGLALAHAQPRPARVVAPPGPPVPTDGMRACARDADCAVALTACCPQCGVQRVETLRAVATAHAAHFARTVCPSPTGCPECVSRTPTDVHAACVSRRCELLVDAPLAVDAGPPDAGPRAPAPDAGACIQARPRVVVGGAPLPAADRACRADADCEVVPAGCCASCTTIPASGARAVARRRRAAVRGRDCRGVVCPACVGRMAPELAAACIRRQCQLVARDLHCETVTPSLERALLGP